MSRGTTGPRDGEGRRPLSRRDFLKLAAAAGAAGSFGSLLVGCATSPEKAPAKPAAGAPTGSAPAAKKDLPEERKVRELELYITTADYDPVRYEFGLMTAAEWRKLGFAVKTTPLEWSRLSQLGIVQHEFDFFTLNWAGRSERIDPDFFTYMVLHSSQVGKGQQNHNGYESKEFDALAEKQRVTMDQEARKKIVWQAQEVFAKDQPHTPIVTRNQLMPYNARDWDGVVPVLGEGLNDLYNIVGMKPKTDKKVLKWGYPSDVTIINPLNTTNTHDFQTLRLIYDRLMQINPTGVPEKWAAQEIKTVSDTVIDVTIRSGMKWHDGKPVTAEDVKFSFEYPAKVKSGYFTGLLKPIKQVTVTGPLSVRFELVAPTAPFFANILGQVFLIPKHIWEGIPEKAGLAKMQDFPNAQPVGSGVFKLEYWRRNEEMKLVRNPDHWLKPAYDELVKIPYANVQGMVAGVTKGEADFGGWWIEPLQVRELEKTAPHIKVANVRNHGYYHINYNMRRKPFDDLAVRTALAHAIPKQLILDRLLEGYGEITHSYISPANEYWHNPNVPKVEYSLDKSRQLLKEAGYEWGSDGRLYYPPGKTN